MSGNEPKYQIKKVKRDGKDIWKLLCPNCKQWGALDDDQLHGRVSVQCTDCDFHETVDFNTICCNGGG